MDNQLVIVHTAVLASLTSGQRPKYSSVMDWPSSKNWQEEYINCSLLVAYMIGASRRCQLASAERETSTTVSCLVGSSLL